MTDDHMVLAWQLRAARMQTLCRDRNEQLVPRVDGSFANYVCECGLKTCESLVTMSVTEYEEVRRQPTHFLVLPGHMGGSEERVVYETPRYRVVEAFGESGRLAVVCDPRAVHRHPSAVDDRQAS